MLRSFYLGSFFLVYCFHKVACQTCECVSSVKAYQPCFGYDSKFQADTLEEAIVSFPDLSIEEQNENEVSDVDCASEYCQSCRREMRKRLEKIGLLSRNINEVNNDIAANSTCTKYSFLLEKSESEDSIESGSSESEEEFSKRKTKKGKGKQRKKRDVITELPEVGLIGTRFTISCSKKGVSVDPTGTVSLCSSCWVWRRLPDNYRPQYVNELVCDQSDSSCLSGYAQCTIGHRSFEAVRNDSGVETFVSLTAGSYCECRISASSSLQSLVEGSGISGTYTPVRNTTHSNVL